jgi:hypothetical protein
MPGHPAKSMRSNKRCHTTLEMSLLCPQEKPPDNGISSKDDRCTAHWILGLGVGGETQIAVLGEVFNILNHTNFDRFTMNTDLSSPGIVGTVVFTPTSRPAIRSLVREAPGTFGWELSLSGSNWVPVFPDRRRCRWS